MKKNTISALLVAAMVFTISACVATATSTLPTTTTVLVIGAIVAGFFLACAYLMEKGK